MKKKLVSVELSDGTVIEDTRVTYSDQVALERTARARGWDPSKQGMQATGFLAWSALTRENKIQVPFEEFESSLVDIDTDEADGAEDSADPTHAGA